MQIQTLFTNFLAINFLELDLPAIEKYCYHVKSNHSGRQVSNIGGWQSLNVVDDPELETIKLKLLEQVMQVHDHYKFTASNTHVITDLWININGTHDFNASHKHPNSMFSGVVYIKVPPNSGEIIFTTPIEAHDYVIRAGMCDELNEFTSYNWWQPPEPGKVIIFPGWLPHYVKPNLSTEDRISISFNTQIYRGVGESSRPR